MVLEGSWVQIPASPKKLDGNDGPLDDRKINENNKNSQMGQVTQQIYACLIVKYFFHVRKKHERV